MTVTAVVILRIRQPTDRIMREILEMREMFET